MIEVWTLPKQRRRHLQRWQEELIKEIDNSINEVVRCQNALDIAISQREAFKKQLTLLEKQFKFES